MSNNRLFLVNAQPGGNKGAEAMLETVVLMLKEKGAEIWIEALDDSSTYAQFCQRVGIPKNTFLFQPRKLWRPYDLKLAKGDLMIDIGGINYTDKSALANLRNFRRHHFFRRAGARTIFFTQDFGPANKLFTQFAARRAFEAATQVMSRSAKSRDLVRSVVPDVKSTGPYPDCTLILPPSEPDISLPDKFVALVPSAIMVNDYGESYMQLMTEVARALPEDTIPFILTHNFTANGRTTDLEVCQNLHRRIASFRQSVLYKEPRAPSVLKGLLARANAVVTSRFHAMVGAVSSNVLVYAIGWSHKYEEFLAPYGLADLAFEMNSLDEDSSSIEIAAQRIVRELSLASNTRLERMRSVNFEQKVRAQQSFRELESLIGAAEAE